MTGTLRAKPPLPQPAKMIQTQAASVTDGDGTGGSLVLAPCTFTYSSASSAQVYGSWFHIEADTSQDSSGHKQAKTASAEGDPGLIPPLGGRQSKKRLPGIRDKEATMVPTSSWERKKVLNGVTMGSHCLCRRQLSCGLPSFRNVMVPQDWPGMGAHSVHGWGWSSRILIGARSEPGLPAQLPLTHYLILHGSPLLTSPPPHTHTSSCWRP